jgi:PA domain
MTMPRFNPSCIAAAVLGLAAVTSSFAANLVLLNVDPPNVGFNDPTPATPVGGNMGTTVGAQRLIAYQRALELWGRTLSSKVDIVVQGSFAGLTCTATGGTLAQAGATQVFADFPNAGLAGHWYGSAVADAIAGQELSTDGFPDIVANFNGNVGQPNCIAGPGWYYGLDNNAGAGQLDFLDTFMHEVSHGLGFQNFVNEVTGLKLTENPATGAPGLPDVYMAKTLDLSTGKFWNLMNAAEIRASAVNNGKVVWTGPAVTASAPLVLGPYEGIRLFGGVSKELVFGSASFGAPASAATLNGSIVVGLDEASAAAGPSPTDGCGPLTNAAAVAGKVVLLDRGTCGFAVKAKNAQLAGAFAVIIANNAAGAGAIALGGSDPTVTVTTIGISLEDGSAIKTSLASAIAVGVEYFVDPTRLSGAVDGQVRLYAPTTVALGSSISHFDTVAKPNLLMEPAINGDLRSATNLDLTPALMTDIGWKLETLKIGSCDSGVPATLATGQLLHVNVEVCKAGASNRGAFVSCMNAVTNAAKDAGLLSGRQHAAITSCTARGTP